MSSRSEATSMIAAASEPSRGDATGVDVAAVRAALLESACWWSAKARHETVSIDRLWICFSCGACGATFDRVFACPEAGDLPLYRGADEVEAVIGDALAARSPIIGAPTWRSVSECACGAPSHHVSVAGAGLFHSVIGSGAGVVSARIDGVTEWLRISDGSGVLEAVDPSSLRSELGRPLTLFDAFRDVVPKLPVDPDMVVGTAAEPGVWLFAAASASALELGIQSKLEARARILVRLDPSTVRRPAWPPALHILASVMEEGAAVAIVVERDVMLAQARAWARTRLGCDVRVEAGRWTLASEKGHWPIAELPIALAMAKAGRTLGEAVAEALTEAARAIEDRIATLRALTELVPGSSFDVDGGTATARLADGRAVRTIELTQLPVGAQALSAELLAREAAFLFDVAPPWADRSRVCPCGAALSIESRLVAWPWDEASTRPRVVRVWAEEGSRGAAEVVALCCDRHVRIPSARELRELGIDGARLEARLNADVAATRPRVHASIWRGSDGESVAVVRGPFVSGLVLSDSRARALYDALGEPFEIARAVGWAIGCDLAALLSDGASEATLVRALSELGIPSVEPFWLRREVDLGVAAIGSFDLVMERRAEKR